MSSVKQTKLLREFRNRTGRKKRWIAPISLREKWIVAAVAIQLLFVSWAFGGVRLWTQYTLSVLSVIGFLILFVRFEDHSAGRRENLKRLLRFPVFWLGLMLMLYMGIQAFNVAWVYATDGRVWWLQRLNHITWLPSGMETPIDGIKIGGMNAYRMMMVYGVPWLLMCTVWIGLRRRRTILILFWILTTSYVLWSLLGLAQKAAGTRQIFWVFDPGSGTFPFSTILYVNHAAAYLNLGLVLLLTLFLYYFNRSKRSMARSGPHILLISIIPLFLVALISCYSNAGTLIGTAIMLLFALVFIIQIFLLRNFIHNPIPILIIILMVTGLGAVTLNVIDQKLLNTEFKDLRKTIESGMQDEMRIPLFKATVDMVKDKWVYGWGAGSYRFYFPVYQRNYHELSQPRYGKPMFFRYAHNDFLQIPAELGAVGSAFIVLIVLYWLRKWLSLGRFMGLPLFMLVAGCALVSSHALVDFPFYNPAVLTTISVLICAGIKLQDIAWERS